MKYLLFLICAFALHNGSAQVNRESELFQQLKSRDSLLFERGFNRCEIDKIEDFISEDLEFFHDQGGLTTNKTDFLNALKSNICSNPDAKPIRKLNDSSLEVYPLFTNGKLYGAIQKGEHEFYIQENGKSLHRTSIAKFTHIWILQEKEWILKEY
ncbi:nuclear transport factor 2 family protein [Christiangramia aquimixticola]|uniref:nuclear transport factor 2 family protein n=1 Tax=Christiangramia aquimixticola TaxID=1697558 RepID=UPI003AA909B3